MTRAEALAIATAAVGSCRHCGNGACTSCIADTLEGRDVPEQPTAEEFSQSLQATTAAERKRCADLARRLALGCGQPGCPCNDGYHIAQAIERGLP